MDPNNNNQAVGINTVQQPASQPVIPTSPTPEVPSTPAQPAPTAAPQAPKGKSSKVIILLVILILLAVGIIAYILFAKNQMNNTQKTTTDSNSSVIIPSPTLVPTLAPEEDLEVSSPEADLMEIDVDVKGL